MFELHPFQWLGEQRKRCFDVHFKVPGKLDYAVCVEGRLPLVWDNEEGCAVDLNADSLRLYSGIKSKYVCVSALKMVAQREMRSKKAPKTRVIDLD